METPIQKDPFRALADPTRREILEVLVRGPQPVQELAARFPWMSRPAVSKHLRILRQAGLATETRDGRRRLYRLEPGALARVSQWISQMEGAAPSGPAVRLPEAEPAVRRKRTAKPVRRREARNRAEGSAVLEPAAASAPSGPSAIGSATDVAAPGTVEERWAEEGTEDAAESLSEGLSGDAQEDGGDWKSW